MIHIPESLVQGCNTPTAINVLSDFIEEITGHKPEFHESGWTTSYEYNNNTTDEYIHNSNVLATSTKRFFYDDDGCGSCQISHEDGLFFVQFHYGYLNGNGIGYGYFNGDGRGSQSRINYCDIHIRKQTDNSTNS